MADVNGDLAGLSQPGGNNLKVVERAKELKIDNFKDEACQVMFWDVFGEQGHPVRVTVSENGTTFARAPPRFERTRPFLLWMLVFFFDEAHLLFADIE
jgi:hypothetical protein